MYFYGPYGTSTCSVDLTVTPTHTIYTFPAAPVRLSPGGVVISADGLYKITFENDSHGVVVSVTTPQGTFPHAALELGPQKFGSGKGALNIMACGVAGDTTSDQEFSMSLGDDPVPACIGRMG